MGGGDVNDVNKNGETALHGAVYRGGAVPVHAVPRSTRARALDVDEHEEWTPLLAAEGVVYASSGIRRYPEAAALIRKHDARRGMAVDESGHLLKRAPAVGRPAASSPAGADESGTACSPTAQGRAGSEV